MTEAATVDEVTAGRGGLPPAWAYATDWRVRSAIDALVIVMCIVLIAVPLHPQLLLSDTTPAGGDMGAHVWAPAYLRDELLPNLRLTGWTPDWYAGFPAFHFYMVVPSLAIVAVNAGLQGPAALLAFAAAVGLGLFALFRLDGWRRPVAFASAIAVAVLGIGVPYGVAFKAVTVAGVLGLPAAAYVFGRMIRFDFPGPAVLAVATVPFLFDRTFSIYGGNIPSTLAGEFAFSIALSLALVYLGVVARGLETGRYRATAAVLLALTGLCHLIPAFFALVGTAVLFAMRPGAGRIRWLAAVGPVAGLLSAFWVAPFYLRRTYLNDMGWEKLAVWNDGESFGTWFAEVREHLVPEDIRWVFFLAVVGIVLSLAFRVKAGVALFLIAIVFVAAFVWLPQGRLWNARILPFYYLSLYLLAAIGVTEVARSLAMLFSPDPQRPSPWIQWVTAPTSYVAMAVVVGLPLAALPLGARNAAGEYQWGPLETTDRSYVPSWSKWNYSGYERKDTYPEYHALVTTMGDVGAEHGCGRSMWEYQKELDRYGTPMALMLLPHWTDGCIGSMEGLYFEASSTTPFHFLIQSELSAAPSSAQRDLPYRGFDINAGIDHLQLLGVRYYLATTTQAITAADGHPDLTEVATSGPWVVYQVAASPVVEGLDEEPAVLEGVGQSQHSWLCSGTNDENRCTGPALDWFQGDPDEQVFLSQGGLDAWQRVAAGETPERREVEPARVDTVRLGTDTISFRVDERDIGKPVLVKASYFPNWDASGAEGPWRVAPNLMLVVPTATSVELRYGWTAVDIGSWVLTFVGLVLLAGLIRRRDPVPVEPVS